MKFRLISKHADGIALLLHLKKLGHKVDFWIKEPEAKPSYKGMIPQVENYAKGLTDESIILFDMVGLGTMADGLKKKYPVYGGGKLNDTLELDREFGMRIAKAGGVKVPNYEKFNSFDKAIAFLKKNDKAYVFKPQGNKLPVYTYVSKDAKDMLEMLDYFKKLWKDKIDFILQEKIEGTEISTEAWYVDGELVPNSINSTVELKRFMDGDKGPNTGCMASLVWFWRKHNPKIYRHTLARIEPFLKRHKYNSPLDMNCIIADKDGLPYFLEFTTRFGYNAIYAAIPELEPLDEFFFALATGEKPAISPSHKWCGAVRMSIQPYPSGDAKKSAGKPIGNMSLPDIWPLDVKYEDGKFLTAGVDGAICEVTDIGDSIDGLEKSLYAKVDKVNIPDKQYRSDLIVVAKKRIDNLRKQNYF
jgi:phosphoribosylamine--glycine ligase